MFNYSEKVIVNKPIAKVYSLVANVEGYPKFIPWCKSVDLIKQEEEFYYYKILLKIGFISQSFTTKDLMIPNESIEIFLVEGPFKSLYSKWKFKEIEENLTEIDFCIDFELKNALLSKMFGKVFLEANSKILESFISRLEKI